MSTNQDIILEQVNNSIEDLSQKIKSKYPDLSWNIEFEQNESTVKHQDATFKIKVCFADKSIRLLDLQFTLDDQNNLLIDGGLVDDLKIIQLLGNRRTFQKLSDTLKSYIINSKNIIYYSKARLKSSMAYNQSNLKTMRRIFLEVMMQIEFVFLAVISELKLSEG